jgi:hypothetical protein
MIAGFPATPLALPNPPCPIPDPKEPRTRSLAVLSSESPADIARPAADEDQTGLMSRACVADGQAFSGSLPKSRLLRHYGRTAWGGVVA